MNKILITFLLFFPLYANALVDYSDSTSVRGQKKNIRKKKQSIKIPSNVASSKTSQKQRFSGPSSFDLKLTHESINLEEFDAKVGLNRIHGFFQTPYNIFLDVNYWMAQSNDDLMTSTSEYQAGNVDLRLGFNWLNFGGVSDQANINFLLGGNLAGGKSDFSHSRSDKYVGIETSKKFLDFIVGFGYGLTLTGTPSRNEDILIGNIQTLSMAIGWVVSSDIRFVLEGESFKILSKVDDGRISLDRDYQFSYISPKVILGLSPYVSLEMGGIFRTKREEITDEFIKAKLWDQKGAYGNSIYASLSLRF